MARLAYLLFAFPGAAAVAEPASLASAPHAPSAALRGAKPEAARGLQQLPSPAQFVLTDTHTWAPFAAGANNGGTPLGCYVSPAGALTCYGIAAPASTASPWTSVQTGQSADHYFAQRADGTLAGFGYNGEGRLDPSGSTAASYALGGHCTFTLTASGALAAAGANWGQCETRAGVWANVFPQFLSTCAVSTTGDVSCWGESHGTVPASGVFVTQGDKTNIVLAADGTATPWGWYALAAPAPRLRLVAVNHANPPGACGLQADWTIFCWGGSTGVPPGGVFVYVAYVAYGFCGARMSGAVACWGEVDAGLEAFLEEVTVALPSALRLPCPASYYCSSGAPVLCPAGSYCPLSSSDPIPCAAGAFSVQGATSCAFTATTCPVGTYASGAAACMPCYPVTACTVPGLSAQPPCFWNVSTFAGNGALASIDGLGSAASFSNPRGIAIDRLSNTVYVSDIGSSVVRAVSSEGLVTTLAGSGSLGSADGAGTSASFNGPRDLTVGPGVIYVSDTMNSLIRTVSFSGIVSTLAGDGTNRFADGQGTYAGFYGPHGLVFWNGFLYVCDLNNHRVRAVTPGGAVSTFAGNGNVESLDGQGTSASFNYPTAITAAPSGMLYVADWFGHRIRSISSSAFVTTLIGNGNPVTVDGIGTGASIQQPIGLEASEHMLFVTSASSVRTMSFETLSVETIAGSSFGNIDGFGTSALLGSPTALALSQRGVLYTPDTETNRIRQLACVPCPVSNYCSSGTPQLCPAGAFCPLSSINPIPCPANSFSPAEGASACTPATECPIGAYYSNTAATPTTDAVCGCAPGAASNGLTGAALVCGLPPGAECSFNSNCSSSACAGGSCCALEDARLGCSSCAPLTGLCTLQSPGKACATPFDCATNVCAGGCCCSAAAAWATVTALGSSAGAPACASCRCLSDADTTALTAGVCIPPASPTATASTSPSPSRTGTPSSTATPSRTPTGRATPSRTPTGPATPSRTPTRPATPSRTPTRTPSRTPSPATRSRTASRTATKSRR